MNKHNNNALSICKYILDSMIYRQKLLGEEENFKNKLALIEVTYTSPNLLKFSSLSFIILIIFPKLFDLENNFLILI